MEYEFKTKVIYLKSGSTVREAKAIMQDNRIRHLPIVNDKNEIISVLSTHDLTDVAKFQDLQADLFASSPVNFVSNDAGIKTVALKMIEKKISCVLLTDNYKNVVGIVTTNDLLFHLVHLLNENESIKPTATNSSALVTIGEFFRKLSDIGI